MKKSFVFLITLILLLPIRGCTFQKINQSSVAEFNCKYHKNPVEIPGTPSIIMSTSYCKDYTFKPEKMSKVITLFVKEYSEQFHENEITVWKLLSNLSIEISSIPRTVSNLYDISGNYLKDETPISGLAISKNKIWVEIRTSQIWSSSLAHELIHIIIWRVNGVHGDPDHEGKQFSGWNKKHSDFIDRFNKKLLDLDL